MAEVALDPQVVKNWYKNPIVTQTILQNAKDREVAVKFGSKGFGKRPDILKYPDDVSAYVDQGATSFHVSEEIWSNVLQINPELRRAEMDQLRAGWDLVLDIDCPELDYSKIAADLLVKALEHHGIKAVSVKFSGNHGFHLAVPFKAFPESVRSKVTKEMFPEGPRRIAFFLKDFIRDALQRKLLEYEPIEKITQRLGKSFLDLVKEGKFDPYQVLDIDTVLISSRHLYRSLYSFNEKSGLVSIPVDKTKILEFSKEMADPKTYKPELFDFITLHPEGDEGKQLLVQAFDYVPKEDKPKPAEMSEFKAVEEAIPEEFFPPCIKGMLAGLEDGKKRSLFILTNFLRTVGWSYEMIDDRLEKWNEVNKDPLKEVLLKGQTRYHKQQQKNILPPNCQNVMYYTDLRVCNPDNFCPRIRNPANYTIRKARLTEKNQKKGKKSKQEESKTTQPVNAQDSNHSNEGSVTETQVPKE